MIRVRLLSPVSVLILGLAVGVAPALAGGITANQLDDFEDGTTASWAEGNPSPNPPTNVADGGPMGNGDNFLQNVSAGFGGPGSRQIVFNRDQWVGDFVAAGVRQIEFDASSLGSGDLAVRIGIQGPGNTRWVSSTSVTLSGGGAWVPVTFSLNEASMTRVSGIADFATTMAAVNEFRILSAQGVTWLGDLGDSTMGIDNVFASTVPVELMQFTVE